MEPTEAQLRRLLELLRQMLRLQWRARFIDVTPGGEIVLILEHATNPNWRYRYTIRKDGSWSEGDFYV